jgi:peptidoglycan/LPS O-acetylase OafA/YrhL
MKRGTSLYLDLVRFGAAFVVFLEHLREHTRNSFAAFWRSHPFLYFHLDAYSETAVIVFFVLSGYVIAHVLATRENTLREFATGRLARLYSVAFPALLLVAATNYAEALRYPSAFDAYDSIPAAIRYAGTGLFVSHFWVWPDLEPANAPFWSLSFEASYYVGIAIFIFAKGYGRLAGLIMLSLLAGPTMVLLAPTWLLGYGAYHFSQRRLHASVAAGIWLLSTALLLSCFFIEESLRQPLRFLRMPDATVGGLLAAYAAALCFVVNVLAFDSFSATAARVLQPVSRIIRWLGTMTFALYLFHEPVLSVLTVYPLAGRSSVAQMAALVGFTFLVVATVGRLCEQSKGAYRRFFLFVGERFSFLPPSPKPHTP